MASFNTVGLDGRWRVTDPGVRVRDLRLMGSLDRMSERIMGASSDVIFNQMSRAYRSGYYGRAWMMSQLGTEIPAGPLPVESVQAAILAPFEGSTFFARMGASRFEFMRKVRSSITLSQIHGETIFQAQKRLADELGWDIRRTTRALKARNKGLFARTERIARTEILRSSNIGAETVMRENQDVVKGWEWLTARDELVCPICGPLDGEQFKFESTMFRPPAHPNCRCTTIPVVEDSARPARETYTEWSARRGVQGDDGGILRTVRSKVPKKAA